MEEELKEIINSLLELPLERKHDLIAECYKQIRDDFRAFNDQDGNTPALAALAAVNGEVTYSERIAVRKVLELEGVDMDDAALKSFFLHSAASDRFCKLARFSKTLDHDKRAALFTFTAAICSCDNHVDEKEYGYLYRLVSD